MIGLRDYLVRCNEDTMLSVNTGKITYMGRPDEIRVQILEKHPEHLSYVIDRTENDTGARMLFIWIKEAKNGGKQFSQIPNWL